MRMRSKIFVLCLCLILTASFFGTSTIVYAIPSKTAHTNTEKTIWWELDGVKDGSSSHNHRSARSFRGWGDEDDPYSAFAVWDDEQYRISKAPVFDLGHGFIEESRGSVAIPDYYFKGDWTTDDAKKAKSKIGQAFKMWGDVMSDRLDLVTGIAFEETTTEADAEIIIYWENIDDYDCGGKWAYGITVTGEPVGTGDGIADIFDLAHAPVIVSSETVYVAGVKKTRDTDYSIDYQIGRIFFETAPATGAAITADYTYYIKPYLKFDSVPPDKLVTVTGEAVGTGDGTKKVFDLAHKPVKEDSQTIYVDQPSPPTYTIDYQAGKITFTTAPDVGAAITADYTYFKSGGKWSFAVDPKTIGADEWHFLSVALHETGHVVGLWHQKDGDLMDPTVGEPRNSDFDCDGKRRYFTKLDEYDIWDGTKWLAPVKDPDPVEAVRDLYSIPKPTVVCTVPEFPFTLPLITSVAMCSYLLIKGKLSRTKQRFSRSKRRE